MKTVPECDLNWIQDCDGLGMIAKSRQAEMLQDANAVSEQHPSLVSKFIHFVQQRALSIAVANTAINSAQANRAEPADT